MILTSFHNQSKEIWASFLLVTLKIYFTIPPFLGISFSIIQKYKKITTSKNGINKPLSLLLSELWPLYWFRDFTTQILGGEFQEVFFFTVFYSFHHFFASYVVLRQVSFASGPSLYYIFILTINPTIFAER